MRDKEGKWQWKDGGREIRIKEGIRRINQWSTVEAEGGLNDNYNHLGRGSVYPRGLKERTSFKGSKEGTDRRSTCYTLILLSVSVQVGQCVD